jgi:protein-tyrosine phosphatase
MPQAEAERMPQAARTGTGENWRPPALKDGAWVLVGKDWLAASAHPKSKEEVLAWGADAVASLNKDDCRAHDIEAEAVSAGQLKAHRLFPLQRICTPDYTPDDCEQLASFVNWALGEWTKGRKVLVHCSQGLHRAGVAIYLLLRSAMGADKNTDSIMKEMCPRMLEEFHKKHLRAKAERIFHDPAFLDAVFTSQ